VDIFVFPGQGSQKVGMGAGLFDEVSEYRSVESIVDDILGYSLRRLCLENPEKNINKTQFTQSALYVVNALFYYRAVSSGLSPKLMAGHSLGEYNALLAAGAFDFITGLRLVKMRGELMAEASGGGMAAVMGLNPDRILQVIDDSGFTRIDIANYNSPSQTVISGPREDIIRIAPFLEKMGATNYFPLPVSAAFHSRYMQVSAAAFDRFLADFQFKAPEIQVVANATALPYPSDGASSGVRELLVRQISSSVQWQKSISYLISRGATTFHEIGPGEVLSRLIKEISGKV
jgi:malonyl CoA-acyl carrier protein transacylase